MFVNLKVKENSPHTIPELKEEIKRWLTTCSQAFCELVVKNFKDGIRRGKGGLMPDIIFLI